MSDWTFKNYLLGSLSEDDSIELELRVLDDEDLAAELFSVEEDLIQAFLSGELSEEDEGRFKADYLVTSERIKNVEMTALMQRYARENANKTYDVGELNPNEKSGLFEWFNAMGVGLRFAAVSIAVIVVATSMWYFLQPPSDNELIALQIRYERINQDPSFGSIATSLSEMTLVSDTLRSAPSTAELERATLTEDIRFRLALPPQTNATASYDVIIFRNSTIVFRQNNIKPLSESAIPELRMILPREVFALGNHRAVLTNSDAGEVVYHFVVK